jgi:DNA-binding response OmpR family regulator/anti-sigma regulatory factor (Ser/Thr protein kinase)
MRRTLVLLDLTLPDAEGLELARRIRGAHQLPIIMVTTRTQLRDKVAGFDAGADDYVTKPFSFEELTAQIRAVLGRTGRGSSRLEAGPLVVDAEQRTARWHGEPLELTPREFDLLAMLARRPGRVYSREEFLDRIWGFDFDGESNVVEATVRRLREKLGEKLTATSRAIAEGAWGRRSELPHGDDEVGRLASSFDAMVHRLQMALEAQHRFVADAAHQLKTPLTALSGHLELLDRGLIADAERVTASYGAMRAQLRRLASMVQKLLMLSILDAGVPLERRPADLAEIARLGGSRADVDPDQIREALSNLIDNAIRHTRADGAIVIEISDGRITVRDNGEGIAADRLPKIFDRFHRHPPAGEGHGLGLAIVRSIVEAHGGTVLAQSERGVGTAITLALPEARPAH